MFECSARKSVLHLVVACVMSISINIPSTVLADDSQMNQTLVQIINQLNAILPLINQAEREQDKTNSEQFHFDAYITADGIRHTGLRQDIIAIRDGLIAQINRPAIEPKYVKPLNNDFVGSHS